MIDRFGNLANILDTDIAVLKASLGNKQDAAAAIVAARQFVLAGWSEWRIGTKVEISDHRFHEHLLARLQTNREERMLAIFTDQAGDFMCEELLATGSFSGLSIRKRSLVQKLLDFGAHGLVLAHNHPSGVAYPSQNDVESTQRIRAIIEPLEFQLLDHLIVARGRIFSMQRGELL